MPEGDYEGKVSYSLQGNYVAVTWPTLKEKIYGTAQKRQQNRSAIGSCGGYGYIGAV